MVIDFSSERVDFCVGDSPESLAKVLNGLGRPVRIVQILSYGYRHVAYFVEVNENKPVKKSKGA